jgi:hypothetical protein
MRRVIELLDVYHIVLELDDRAFIIINITVIRSRKNGNDRREVHCVIPFVHFKAVQLSFMGSNNGQKVVFVEERGRSFGSKKIKLNFFVPEDVGTSSCAVVIPTHGHCLFVIFTRVSPEEITERSLFRWLHESADFVYFVELKFNYLFFYGFDARGDTSMNSHEFLIYHTGQR